MVSQKSIALAVTLLVLLLLGMFWFAYLERSSNVVADVPPNTPLNPEEIKVPTYISQIDAKHYITETGHVIVGEVTLPTPCDLLEVSPVVRESYPEQVELQFSIINSAEVCAQVLTTQRFRVDVSASPEAVFSASYQDQPLTLNLVPALSDESPDDFELFIKG